LAAGWLSGFAGAAGFTCASAGLAASTAAAVNCKRELTRDFIGDLNSFILKGYPIPSLSIHTFGEAFQ
jgi:hypothetical protein